MDGWMVHERRDGQMDERKDEWMVHGWIDGWMVYE
jgi:hypothetical protein